MKEGKWAQLTPTEYTIVTSIDKDDIDSSIREDTSQYAEAIRCIKYDQVDQTIKELLNGDGGHQSLAFVFKFFVMCDEASATLLTASPVSCRMLTTAIKSDFQELYKDVALVPLIPSFKGFNEQLLKLITKLVTSDDAYADQVA
jgi:hypothetical protein